MTAWLNFLSWVGACVAVQHHAERMRHVCYDGSGAAHRVVLDYDAAHERAAEGARAAGRAVKNLASTAPWLRQARRLHRQQCGCVR